MANLRDQFQHFYAPGEDDIATAMQTGLVTPDTNVLLALYRFQAGARDELFGALEKLGDRLWIPHQVGLEFHRNRINVISDQQQFFKETRQDLEQSITALKKIVIAFGARIALGKDHIEHLDDRIEALFTDLLEEVRTAEMANEVRLKDHDLDKVLARLEALLDGRVGEPMGPKELEDARKEARRRVDAGEPPGYKDRGKADPTGDYLVWKQLINEAKERKLPVVFITDDRKDDWYRREHGLTLGARYELRDEMIAEAGVPLLIMRTQIFLEHARKYLDAEVSPETVDQAKELPAIIDDDVRSEMDRRMAAYAARQGAWEQVREVLDSNAAAVLASLTTEERDALHQHMITGSGFLSQQGKPIDKERVALAAWLLSGRRKRDDQPPGEEAPPEE